MASVQDMRAADVVLVVKRVPEELLMNLRASGKPWAYDVVDAYPQPECSGWTQAQSIAWLKSHIARLKPNAVIWPNQRMAADLGQVGNVVYHHHLPGIKRNPIRKRIETIGYQGAVHYLEGWTDAIGKECQRRGIRFVMNAQLADVDVILALRGGKWNGYPQRNWKSNVKLANAHGSGTPFIGARECGYEETATGCEYWADTPQELAGALDWLELQSTRQHIAQKFIESAITVQQAAEKTRAILCALKS